MHNPEGRGRPSASDLDGGAHIHCLEQLADMGVEHAHTTEADSGTDFHPVRPGGSMNPKFTSTVAMKGQVAVTNWTGWSTQLLALA